MNDIIEKVNKKYHYKIKYIIGLCIAIASILFMGMIVFGLVLLSNTVIATWKDALAYLVLILVPTLYLRWFWQNWRTPNRSISQYYDIDPKQLTQMIEKEAFHDYSDEKIPSKLYQESQNFYMICGRFIARKSVLSVQTGTTGGYGGKGGSSQTYKLILSNGKKVSLNTPYYIRLSGKICPDFYDDSEKRYQWGTFYRTRKSIIRSFYKQWISAGNQPISLLTDEEVVDEYKKQLMKYIMGKKRG